jgi:hypothetical protein
MQTFFDFLSFKHFITADILIVCYYIGALVIPVLLYYFRRYLIEKIFLIRALNDFLRQAFSSLDPKNRLYAKILFIGIFLAMETVWRMMFEMMIGYFQMHDYLQQIAY